MPCHQAHRAALVALALALSPAAATAGEQVRFVHAIAMHGAPKYAPGFAHFDYVEPDAPKRGTLRRGRVGSFDSLNPFAIKGVPAHGLNLVYEPLLARTMDEPFTLYALLAESVAVPAVPTTASTTARSSARKLPARAECASPSAPAPTPRCRSTGSLSTAGGRRRSLMGSIERKLTLT